MDRGRLRWPVALFAAVVVAEAAVLVFRPRAGVIDPAPVNTRSYFSDEQVDRARDFRRPQLALSLLIMGIEAGILILLVRRPPKALTKPRKRPLVAAAAAGAALSLGISVATLPVSAIMRQRAKDVGLITQGWDGWALDRVKAEAIGLPLAGAGALLLVALMRRLPRGWWAPAAAGVVAFGALSIYAGPLVLDPIFNTFKPLPEGRLREDVLALVRKAGVNAGQVYEMDASQRTTAANAYVAGLGNSKRVVLYDNLIKDFDPDETRLVVAHELAHVRYDDLGNGLLYLAIVAPFGMFAVAMGVRDFGPKEKRATAAVLPATLLALGITQFAITTVSNQLSRDVEARADTYALELTGEPEPFIGFEQRIAIKNVADPDPPALQTFFLATHPPTLERIGIGKAYEASKAGSATTDPRRPRPRPDRTPEGS